MKNKITLLIMSKKLNVIKAIIEKKISHHINFVVSSTDLNVKNDFLKK